MVYRVVSDHITLPRVLGSLAIKCRSAWASWATRYALYDGAFSGYAMYNPKDKGQVSKLAVSWG